MKKVFHVRDYAGDDMTRLANACRDLRDNPGATLVLDPGHYTVTSELARKTMQDCISGVYGGDPEKTMFRPDFAYDIGLDLSDMQNVTVMAERAVLDVVGFMEPVSITRSRGVKVVGLTVRHVRKPYSRGVITNLCRAVDEQRDFLDVQYDTENFPLTDGFPMPHYALYSEKEKRYVYYEKLGVYEMKQLDPRTWRMYANGVRDDMLGCIWYAWHTYHSRPAVMIQDSESVVLKKVTIHDQPGMGVVAHRSKDILFDRLAVVPDKGEHLSTNTDATHIASCSGFVRYIQCRFDGQGDDSLNVHTYYHTICEINGRVCRVEMRAPTGTHSQKQDYPEIGDTMELTDPKTLFGKDLYTVVSCRKEDNRTLTLEMDRPIEALSGDLFVDATQCPHLYVRKCTMQNHIARGALIKTKWAEVSGCRFEDITGGAIEVAAEAWWAEGLCSTENIVIKNNVIRNCGRSIPVKGSGGIAVSVDADAPTEKTHKNVVIVNNRISCPDAPHAVFASNTEHLTVKKNNLVSAAEPVKIV